MTAPSKPFLPRRILLFIGFGLLTLGLYLYYFVGTSNIVDVIRRADVLVYSSAFMAFIVAVLFASLAWRSLLDNLAVKVTVRRVFFLMWVGMFFDAIVPEPGWSGDFTKSYMLAKTSDQKAGRIVASVVGQKIIVMVVTVAELILGLLLIARNYLFSQGVILFIVAVLVLTVFSLAIVWYLSTRRAATRRMLSWLVSAGMFIRRGRWNPGEFQAKAEEFLEKFHEGIGALGSRPTRLIQPALFTLLSSGFDVSVVFLTFASLGYPVPVDKVLIIYALTGSLQIMGISFVGFTEVIVSGAYTVLGIPAPLSLSVTLLTRVVTLWFKMVVSYVAFQWAGIRMLSSRRQISNVPPPQGAEEDFVV
jgi:uncharacterized protein (TIRG00374 family)